MQSATTTGAAGAAWTDRHPVAAALLALSAGYTLIGVILAYPWFFVPLLVVAAAWWLTSGSNVARRSRHERTTNTVR